MFSLNLGSEDLDLSLVGSVVESDSVYNDVVWRGSGSGQIACASNGGEVWNAFY